jgi:UDP-3-O-[3-hydroxymyristoyl] glucosamine N-acyltransferase
VEKGENVIIKAGAVIGENVRIGNNVIIYEGTVLGDNVTIQDNAVIGKQPFRAKDSILPDSKQLTPAVIGSGVTIGTSAIIYANATISQDVFVADLATVRERVFIGERTIIGRGVAVENDCKIGKRCKLETNCYITAYSELGDCVFIAPCVVTTNDNDMARNSNPSAEYKGVTVKTGGRIGANATVLPGIVINEEGAVGAGSIVTKEVNKQDLVIGSPAKKLRDVPESQLLKNQKF